MVAHSIGVIAIQAGAARPGHRHPAGGGRARRSTTIEATSRETLSGLRRMLGALRRAEPDPGPAARRAHRRRRAARPAAPGLPTSTGSPRRPRPPASASDVRWRGRRRPLPPDIDLAAFRIVQEALTNVVRHAGTDSCRVTVDCRDGRTVRGDHRTTGGGGRRGHRVRPGRHARAGRPAARRVHRGHRVPRAASGWPPGCPCRRGGPMTRPPPYPPSASCSPTTSPSSARPCAMLIADTAGPGGRGRGGNGRRGGPAGGANSPRRRRDGHPHARHGRHRGHPADHGRGRARPACVVLTTFDDDDYVYGALRAGASRIPRQGHGPGRHPRRDPGGGRRGRPDRAERHHAG